VALLEERLTALESTLASLTSTTAVPPGSVPVPETDPADLAAGGKAARELATGDWKIPDVESPKALPAAMFEYTFPTLPASGSRRPKSLKLSETKLASTLLKHWLPKGGLMANYVQRHGFGAEGRHRECRRWAQMVDAIRADDPEALEMACRNLAGMMLTDQYGPALADELELRPPDFGLPLAFRRTVIKNVRAAARLKARSQQQV